MSKQKTVFNYFNPLGVVWLGFSVLWTGALQGAPTPTSHPPEAGVTVCPGVYFTSQAVDLDTVERVLLCGSDKSPWKRPAPWEAQNYMVNILQKRGYHHPVFSRTPRGLEVELGPRSYFSSLELKVDLPFPSSQFRKWKGKPLTPEILDAVEAWALTDLRRSGYACAKIEVKAFPDRGKVVVGGKNGELQYFPRIQRGSLASLETSAVSRLDAFVPGQLYNVDLVALTEDRAAQSSLVSSLYHQVSCGENGLEIRQNVIEGPARSVRLGVGVNTESGPLVRAKWSHGRLTSLGTPLDLEVRASLREQSFTGKIDWFGIPSLPRYWWGTELSVHHFIENNARWMEGRLHLWPSYSWETSGGKISTSVGPSLNATKRFRGPGVGESAFMTWDAQIDWISHYYEFYRSSPHQGSRVHLGVTSAWEGVFSDVTFQNYDARFQKYFILGGSYPSVGVMALRGGVGSTVTQDRSLLPTGQFHFLGGARDLRGFSRGVLPGESGALTKAYLGAEIRIENLILDQISPLFFLDVGKLGINSFTLDPGFYWSPGLGLRWASPIGAVQALTGLGFSEGLRSASASSGWQFYLSLGEEF